MKISWWQGGLHIAPESKAETDALMLLWNAKREAQRLLRSEPPAETSSGILKQSQNSIVAD